MGNNAFFQVLVCNHIHDCENNRVKLKYMYNITSCDFSIGLSNCYGGVVVCMNTIRINIYAMYC